MRNYTYLYISAHAGSPNAFSCSISLAILASRLVNIIVRLAVCCLKYTSKFQLTALE